MSKQKIRKPLSIALGTVVVTGLGLSGIANANELDDNLFAMEELTSGYLTAGGHEKSDDEGEGSCGEGEGNCGEDKKDEGEGKCGEGKCGGDS